MEHDAFQLEEYKQLRARLQVHENRYYQMLVFSVTGFATVIGFSESLPPELIPYMLAPFIFVTSRIAGRNRQHRYWQAACILEFHDTRVDSLNSESAYYKIYAPGKKPQFRSRVLRKLALLFRPFMILIHLNYLVIIYFVALSWTSLWQQIPTIFAFIYLGILVGFYLLTIISFIPFLRKNLHYYRQQIQKMYPKKELKNK